jgi:hypothetical protein
VYCISQTIPIKLFWQIKFGISKKKKEMDDGISTKLENKREKM